MTASRLICVLLSANIVTANVEALRIGVVREPADLPVLTFCVDRAEVDSFVMLNCADVYGTNVSFTRQSGGYWLKAAGSGNRE